MRNTIKKAISLVLVIGISTTISVPGLAATIHDPERIIIKQSDGNYKVNNLGTSEGVKVTINKDGMYQDENGKLFSKVKDDLFIPVKKVDIPLENIETTNAVIKQQNIQKETTNYILDVIANSKKNQIHIDSIQVYLPQATSSRRTYKGYGNKTYFEETVTTNYHSDPADVNQSPWGTYKNSVIKGIAEYIVGEVADKVTFGSYSIASIFASAVPSSVSGTTEVTHYAQLFETKTTKHTYVVEDGQYYFGSLTEKASGKFENFISIPGVSGGNKRGSDSKISNIQTQNYSSADKRAYYGYVSGGWVERIESYQYGQATFNSAYSS
ncbi:hypothetical protein [Caproiciproducens sp. LBM24188]